MYCMIINRAGLELLISHAYAYHQFLMIYVYIYMLIYVNQMTTSCDSLSWGYGDIYLQKLAVNSIKGTVVQENNPHSRRILSIHIFA